MALDPVDYLQGSLSLIFVIISLIIGLIILSKYPKSKNKNLILVGLTWWFLATPWVPDSVSFLMNVFVQQSLPIGLYFIFGNVFLPLALICWITAIADMIYKKRKILSVTLISILGVIFEIIFFYLLLTDIDLLGVINPLRPFSADLGIFLTVSFLLTTLIMLVTGLIFARKSLRSENKDIRLKGKLLRAAFISFTVAVVLEKVARSLLIGVVFTDPNLPILSIMLVVVRVLLMLSAFEFYGGFILPRWIQAIFGRK